MKQQDIVKINYYTKNITINTVELLSTMDKKSPEYKLVRRWFSDYVLAYGTTLSTDSKVPLTLSIDYYFDHVIPKIENGDEDNDIIVMSIKDGLGYIYRTLDELTENML